jgi:hypothetical protein
MSMSVMSVSRCWWIAGIERDVNDSFTAYKVSNEICAGV